MDRSCRGAGACGVIVSFAAYALAHALMRLALSPNIAQDDVTSTLFAQTLELGYTTRQPPLYEWLLWAVQQVVGPSLAGFLLLKYALLTPAAVFVYLAARDIMQDRGWAAAAALSLTLLYQIGWNIHEGVTHTATLMAAVVATFWLFMRLLNQPTALNSALFGAALGFGFLSKYGFAVFAGLLFAAAAWQPAIRRRLRARLLLASLLLAAAMASPYLYWLSQQGQDIAAQFAGRMAGRGAGEFRRVVGAAKAVYAPIAFLSPLAAILLVLYPPAVRALRKALSRLPATGETPDLEKLLLTMALAGVLMLLLGALLFGASNYRERYMHVLFLLTPVWMVALCRRASAGRHGPGRLLAAIFVFAAIVWSARLALLVYAAEPFCRKCKEAVPYGRLASKLDERGLSRAVIMTGYRHTAGNLRAHLPGATFISLRDPYYRPPISLDESGRPVAVIWDVSTEGRDIPPLAAGEAERLGRRFDSDGAETLVIPWTHLWRAPGYRMSEWKLLVAPRK